MKNLTDSNFTDFVLKSKKPFLVKFYTNNCVHCPAVERVVQSVMPMYNGLIYFGNVNVNNCSELAKHHNIRSVPLLLMYKDGKVISSNSGQISKEDLITMLNNSLK
jgi:thioredoxin 1